MKNAPALIALISLLSACAPLPGGGRFDEASGRFSDPSTGFSVEIPRGWKVEKRPRDLFYAVFRPSGLPVVGMGISREIGAPDIESFLDLERVTTMAEKGKVFAAGEIGNFRLNETRRIDVVSRGPEEGKRYEAQETIWLGEREGIRYIFHTFTFLAGLVQVHLRFEFPVMFYEANAAVMNGILSTVRVTPKRIPSKDDVADSYRIVGLSLKNREAKEAAIRAFKKAVEANPARVDNRLDAADLLREIGEGERAVAEYQEVLKISEQEERALLGIAEIRMKEKKYDETIQLLVPALGFSENPEIFLKLGSAYLQSGRLVDAAETFDRAVRKAPASAEAQKGLGEAYLAQEMLDEAIASLERAVQLNPNLASAHCSLEKAYAKKGMKIEAERERTLCGPFTR